MQEIKGSYSEEENGWASEVLSPTGDIWLEVELPSYGYVVIRQIDKGTGKAPKCYQSKEGRSFKLRVLYDEDTDIQIFTSMTPRKIKYANI